MKNNNNWIVVGKGWIFICFLLMVFVIIISCGFLNGVWNGVPSVINKILFILGIIVNTLLIFALCFILNRLCCVVKTDGEKVTRRGFFFGYHCSVMVKDILYIKKVLFPRDGTYYCLIDNKHLPTSRISKHSAIFIPCSEEGAEFVKSFYNGNIPDPEDW